MLFSFYHSLEIFAYKFPVVRVGSAQILVDINRSFRVIVVDGIIECGELPACHIEIPVRHTDGLERKLHFIISLFKLLVQAVELGDILSEAGEAYGVSILVLFERNADDIAILPGFIVFCLHAASEVDGFVFARQHRLDGIEIGRAVVRVYDTFKFFESNKPVGGIVVDRIIVGLELLCGYVEVPMYDIAHLHGQLALCCQVLCLFQHLHLCTDNQELSPVFGG